MTASQVSVASGGIGDDKNWENSPFWQQQFQLAAISREAAGPHSYARATARGSRPGFNGPQTLDEVAAALVRQAKSKPSASSTTPARGGADPQEKKDQMEAERVRHINEDINKQFWTSIDLSGQGLLCVAPRLFNYTFLQRLYLGHNNLTAVPKSLTKMPQLRVLDLSSNNITELMPEIGLMVSLRYLFLFDNKITSVPSELGNLFQLEILGIDGNPVNDELRSVLANEGTRGLVIKLRDNAPVGEPPKPRKWIQLEDQKTSGGFSLLSYNTLCDRYASPQLYGYTPSWALSWEYRSKLLLEEIAAHETDIICLQEVNTVACEQVWQPFLTPKGYKYVFYPKTRARTMSSPVESKLVDGCVTFYKQDRIRLIAQIPVEYNSKALLKDDLKKSVDIFNRVMTKDNVALIAVFEHINSGHRFVVANTHLHWDPAFKDVKLVQSAILLEELENVAAKYNDGKDIKSLPIVVCGDFNSTPDSGVYQLFSQGKVPPDCDDLKGYSYGKFTETGITHKLNMKSAYADGFELPFTNYTPNFVENIDYIWYSTQPLSVTALLGEVDEEYAKRYVGFPNAHHPSDHIPIVAKFSWH